jgi:hypothetical protein
MIVGLDSERLESPLVEVAAVGKSDANDSRPNSRPL